MPDLTRKLIRKTFWQISAHVDGGRADVLTYADPGARTPIGVSGNLCNIFCKIWTVNAQHWRKMSKIYKFWVVCASFELWLNNKWAKSNNNHTFCMPAESKEFMIFDDFYPKFCDSVWCSTQILPVQTFDIMNTNCGCNKNHFLSSFRHKSVYKCINCDNKHFAHLSS